MSVQSGNRPELRQPRGLIGLVSCSGRKLPRSAPARDLYASPLFRKSRELVELTCDAWAILSAAHGLVLPDRVLEPYDVTLTRLEAAERRRWAEATREEILDVFGRDCTFYVLAGVHYLAALEGLSVITPLAGLGIGKRLRRLDELVVTARSGHGKRQGGARIRENLEEAN